MRRLIPLIVLAAALVLPAPTATAQNVTVQQPVFNNFSVGTTVSVPDRGGAFIGGVSRAGSSRKSYGPLRSGSSFGLFRDYSGVSTHVTIHDLGEMDRRLLQQADGDDFDGDAPIGHRASAHAYSSLLSRYRSRDAGAGSKPADGGLPGEPTPARSDLAARSLRLGLEAEASGKAAVARLHFRMAARHGSEKAAARLQPQSDRPAIASEAQSH